MKKTTGIEKNIRKYYIATALQNFWFIIPIIIIYLQHFGLSYTDIGFLEFVTILPIVLLQLPTGAFADMFGRKISVFIGTSVFALSMIVMGLSSSMSGFIIGYLLWSIGIAFNGGAMEALLFDTLKEMKREKDYLKISGRAKIVSTISIIISVAIGPMLYLVDVRLPWFVFGITTIPAAFMFLSMKEPNIKRRGKSLKEYYQQMKVSIKYSMDNKFIRWLILFSIVFANVAFITWLITQPYLLSIGFDIASFSILFPILYGLTGFVAAFAYKIEKIIGEKTCFALIVFLNIATLFAIWLMRVPAIFFAIIVFFIMRDFRMIVVNNYINYHVKSKERASILSINSMFVNLASMFIVLGAGILTDIITVHNMFFVLGIFTLCLGLPLFLWRYGRRRR